MMLKRLCLSFCLLCLCASCVAMPKDVAGPHVEMAQGEEATDSGCAYFYFLWGKTAELEHRFDEALDAFEKALVCDPGADYVMRDLVLFYMNLNRNDDANRLIGQLLEIYPEDPEILTLEAALYANTGKVDEAEAIYKRILAATPDDGDTLLRLGSLYAANSRFDEARQVLERLVVLDGRSFVGYQYLAKLYRQLGQYDKAIDAYDKALALHWLPDLALEAVDILEYRKQYEKAISYCRRILKSDPDDENARQRLMQVLLRNGEVERALVELRELRKHAVNVFDIDLTIGRVLIEQKLYDRAIAHFGEMLAADPGSGNIHYLLALAHGAKGDDKEAVRYLKKVTPEDSTYEDAVMLQVEMLVRNRKFAEAVNVVDQALADPAGRRPRFYGVLASLYRQQGRNDDGRRLFEKALQMYPEDIMLHYEYALFLDRTGNADDAFVAMQKVLVMDPHNPYALNYIGYTWADRGEKLDEARVFIEKAASLRPDDGFIRDSLGWVYFKLGQYEKALAELTRALELASDPVIFEHLGDVYAKTGQMAEALKAYQQAVSHFAEDEGRQRVEAKIKALGSESQK